MDVRRRRVGQRPLQVSYESRAGVMHLIVVAAAICLSVGADSAGTEAERVIRQPTSIAPQELAHALQLLARDRDLQMVYRSELVNDRRTSGVSGVLTLDEALTQLFCRTGLTYRYLDHNAITIVRTK